MMLPQQLGVGSINFLDCASNWYQARHDLLRI
jgi:hypothetical protein